VPRDLLAQAVAQVNAQGAAERARAAAPAAAVPSPKPTAAKKEGMWLPTRGRGWK
jgi:hypothetical protein